MLSDIEIDKLVRYCVMIGKPLICPFQRKKLGPVSYDITTWIQDYYDWGEGEVIKLVSLEEFNLPREILGIISLRSGATKFELFTNYSSLVDPGYKGKLIFLVYQPKKNWLGSINYERLFQIMFMKVDGKIGVAYNERKSSTAMNRGGF